MHELLKKNIEIVSNINSFTEDDLALAISDKEKVLKVIPGENVPLRVEEGSQLKNNLALYQAMNQQKKVTVIIPKEVHGTLMSATATPITDEYGQIIGAISTVKNISDRDELMEIIRILANSLNEMRKRIAQISANAEAIATTGEGMISTVNTTLSKSKETDQIVSFVQQISKQTNLLGLNAAIEAARAGDAGRGFQVVAEEIRKMAISSNDSVVKIASVLKEIQANVNQILKMVENNSSLTLEQATGTEKITAEITELSSLADKLNEFAHKL